MRPFLWAAIGYAVGKLVEYVTLTDWADEHRRSIDPVYDSVRGPGRSLRWRRG